MCKVAKLLALQKTQRRDESKLGKNNGETDEREEVSKQGVKTGKEGKSTSMEEVTNVAVRRPWK